MTARQYIYCGLGLIVVALGTAGIFLPLLPTTPFLLLATFLFARSSPRLHDWLLGHKYLGPYIHAFRDKSGLTLRQKVRIGMSLTIMMGISFYFVPMASIKWLLVAVWLFWSTMLVVMKTNHEAPGAADARV